jgi:hypothetical protein
VRAAPRRRRGVVDRHRGRGRPLEECKSHGVFPLPDRWLCAARCRPQ